jgi:hypothetical protein
MATTMNRSDGHLPHIADICQEDATGLLKAHESYGDSWKKRGGVGAYMVMIRKFDRMERTVEKAGFDIFQAVEADQRPEGLIDDIRDARRYLVLIEAELRMRGLIRAGDHRDNVVVEHTMKNDCSCPKCSSLRNLLAGGPHGACDDAECSKPGCSAVRGAAAGKKCPVGCDCHSCTEGKHDA